MINRLPLPINGVNVHNDPTTIADGQWQRLRNLAPVKPGIVGTRPGLTYARDVIPTWWHWDARTALGELGVHSAVPSYFRWARDLAPVRFVFNPLYGDITMVALTRQAVEIMRADGPNLDTQTTVPEGTMLLICLPGYFSLGSGGEPLLRAAVLGEVTVQPSLFVWNGTTYAFAGKNAGRKIIRTPDASLPLDFSYDQVNFGPLNGTFHPDGAAVVRDRILYYKGGYIWFSDRQAPETISPATDDYNVMDLYIANADETSDITAAAEINTTADGSPAQSVAMVFTLTSAYMLHGDTLESEIVGEGGDVLGSLQINRLNMKCGCVSQATIKRTPYGTFWVGTDDVWFMPFGSMPMRVGTNIRPLLEAQPRGLLWKIHAEYADGFYRVSLFKDGQGPSIYSPCGMQMWLDLRQGPPRSAEEAMWYGPQEFVNVDSTSGEAGVHCMAVDDRPTGDGKLYSLQTYRMTGDESSDVYGLSLCTFEGGTGRDITSPAEDTYPPWQPSTAYEENDRVSYWLVGIGGSLRIQAVFTCTVAGTSGNTVPGFGFTMLNADGTVAELNPGGPTWRVLYFRTSPRFAMNALRANTAQADSEIVASALSKELMIGDPMVEKLLDGAELGYWTGRAMKLAYNSHPKQDSTSRILTPDYDQAMNRLDGDWTGDRVWQRKLLTASPSKRFRALSAVWELNQEAGIFLTAGFDDTLTLQISGEPVPTVLTFSSSTAWTATTLRNAINAALTPLGFTAELLTGGLTRIAALGGAEATFPAGQRILDHLGFYQPDTLDVFVSGLTSASWISRFTAFEKAASPFQISGINLRVRTFARRPQ